MKQHGPGISPIGAGGYCFVVSGGGAGFTSSKIPMWYWIKVSPQSNLLILGYSFVLIPFWQLAVLQYCV
jgi:hypothetical protein